MTVINQAKVISTPYSKVLKGMKPEINTRYILTNIADEIMKSGKKLLIKSRRNVRLMVER